MLWMTLRAPTWITLKTAFTPQALQAAYPTLDYKAKNIGAGALGGAFAIEAMKRNLIRCLGFSLGGLDTLVFSAGIGEHCPSIRARTGASAHTRNTLTHTHQYNWERITCRVR